MSQPVVYFSLFKEIYDDAWSCWERRFGDGALVRSQPLADVVGLRLPFARVQAEVRWTSFSVPSSAQAVKCEYLHPPLESRQHI